MRELPAVSDDFTKKQLLLRVGFYGLNKAKYNRKTKPEIIAAIQLIENINTRSIEDGQ